MTRVLTPITDRNGKATRVWKNPQIGAPPRTEIVAISQSADGYDSDYEYAIKKLTIGEMAKENAVPLFESLVEQYGEPQCGRTRAVFDRGDGYVIKMAIDYEGQSANGYEASCYEKQDEYSYIPVAQCFIEMSGNVPLLIMEKLDVDTAQGMSYRDLPQWVGSVDCKQVGFNSAGELVAFDL